MNSIDFVGMKQELLDICENESQRERVYAWLCKYVRMSSVVKVVDYGLWLRSDPEKLRQLFQRRMFEELLEANMFSFDEERIKDSIKYTMRVFAIAKPVKVDIDDVA